MFFSIIIPLYNRPQEINELLASLVKQDFTDFEVLVIEDGSSLDAREIVEGYQDKLNIQYYYKDNAGQGFARNYGFERSKGSYLIVFDSDCLIPAHYLSTVYKTLGETHLDAYGGPDAAHASFSPTQKAISYAMTSPLTTGGIRGNKKHVGKFHPRSFNMGISREVWERTGGYKLARRSEDIEFSIRMINAGFKVGLIPEAFVYHKRRTDFKAFFRQTYGFGRGRIHIYTYFPKELKAVHFFPSLFVLYLAGTLLANLLHWPLARLGNVLLGIYVSLLLVHAFWRTRSLKVTLLSLVAAFTQLIAYGLGFLRELMHYLLHRKQR